MEVRWSGEERQVNRWTPLGTKFVFVKFHKVVFKMYFRLFWTFCPPDCILSEKSVEIQVAKDDDAVHKVKKELVDGHHAKQPHGPYLNCLYQYSTFFFNGSPRLVGSKLDTRGMMTSLRLTCRTSGWRRWARWRQWRPGWVRWRTDGSCWSSLSRILRQSGCQPGQREPFQRQ